MIVPSVSKVTIEELNYTCKKMYTFKCWYAYDNKRRFCKEHGVFGVDLLYVIPVRNPNGGADQTIQEKFTTCPDCLMEGKVMLGSVCDLEKVST